MRIAYVTIHVAPEIMQGGVGNKIRSHISIWRERRHEVTLFSLTPAEIPFPGEQQFVFDDKGGLIKREIQRAIFLKKMLRAVREYNPDIIYLRYGLYSYPLHQLFKIAPVAVEINANDADEYRTRGMFFYLFNRLTRGIILSLSSGLIPVTNELGEINARFEKPVCVISNGIDLNASQPMPAPKNKTPVLTMIGSPGMDWHGMDKLIPFAKKYPELQIHIIGYSPADFAEQLPENMIAHGYLKQAQVKVILETTDVEFGTLALHRKKMEELPPLKIREALAFGIPVIIAYKDMDLMDVNLDTILRLPNSENNVLEHAEKIRDFAYRMMGRRVDVDVVAPFFDQRIKETARLEFFEKIIGASRIQ